MQQSNGYAPVGMAPHAKLLLGAVVLAILYWLYTNQDKVSNFLRPSPQQVTSLTQERSGLKPLQPSVPKWNYKGCYVDNGGHRGLPDFMGVLDFNSCQNAASAKGYNLIGMQYHEGSSGTETSQCFGSKDTVYDALGTATNCSFNDADGHLHGGFDSNAIYKLE